MKKAIVLLLALLAVGSMVFAIDAPAATYALTADGYAKWQYNLDAGNSGFTNGYDLSFKYYLMDNVSATKGGEGTYGQIDITHLNLIVGEVTDTAVDTPAWKLDDADGNNIGISAKIVMGALSIGVYGAPSGDYENAKYVPLFNADAGYATDSSFEPVIAPNAGITVGYSLGDMGSVTFGVGSMKAFSGAEATAATVTTEFYVATGTETATAGVTYTTLAGVAQPLPLAADNAYIRVTTVAAVAAGAGNTDEYAFGVDVVLNPVKDMVSLTAGAWYDLKAKLAVMGGKLSLTAGDFSAYGAIDASYDTALKFDAAANVTYNMNEKKDALKLDAYFLDTSVATGHQGDVGLTFVDAEGFVPGLSFTLGAFMTDVMKVQDKISVAESVSYKIGDITPREKFWYDLLDGGSYLNIGVDYTGIANTTLTAQFEMGGTTTDNNWMLTGGKAATDKVITFIAKVTL